MVLRFRASKTWLPWLRDLLSPLRFQRRKIEAHPISPLVEIGRMPLGVEAYDLCPDDRQLVAELADEVLRLGPIDPAPATLPLALRGRRTAAVAGDPDAHLKEIGNRLDQIAGRLLSAAAFAARADELHGEIEARLSMARDALAASEASLRERDRGRGPTR
jgi:hypothetical protein